MTLALVVFVDSTSVRVRSPCGACIVFVADRTFVVTIDKELTKPITAITFDASGRSRKNGQNENLSHWSCIRPHACNVFMVV